MELWEILVPTQWNDGTPIKLKHHKQWDEKVKAITGGLTILTPAKGQWVAPTGTNFDERMIPVRFAVEQDWLTFTTTSSVTPPQPPRKVKEIMRITCKHYDQLAVMCYRVADVTFIWNRETLLGDEPMWRKSG